MFFDTFPFILEYLITPTRLKITELTRWFMFSPELQSVFSTSMVLQDRYKNMTGNIQKKKTRNL